MKIGLLYTGTTPELTRLVEDAVRRELGDDIELFSVRDSSIIAEARDAGYVTTSAAVKWIALYLQAVDEGCDAVLSVCSSVGDVADAAQGIAVYLEVPLVRIDEGMCWEAVKCSDRIGVVASLPVSLAPVRRTIERMSWERGKSVELFDCLAGGDYLVQSVASSDAVVSRRVDMLVLAQASMADHEAAIAEACRMPVLSSPRFGAAALRAVLERRDIL